MTNYTLHHGDCLDILPTLPPSSVDAVIADPPYGTTACKWDSVIPFDAMWRELKRIVKSRGAIVLFGSQPFTSALVMSNPKWFRYEWVWQKNKPTGSLNVIRQPMRSHENILVFSSNSSIYNPQKYGARQRSTGRVCELIPQSTGSRMVYTANILGRLFVFALR